MSNKRRNTSSPECESPRPKKQQSQALSFDGLYKDQEEVQTDEKPQVDAYTGQTGAFPGLSTTEDELFYGPANDGIDYLRMVRSEAKGIPQLLRVQAEEGNLDEHDHGEEEEGGYWDYNGTYTANSDANNGVTKETLPKAQIEYYNSLLAQFALVRATMKCVPPLAAIEKLTSSQPISFPAENRTARENWLQCLKTRDPSPVQIACMDGASALNLVRLLSAKLKHLCRSDQVGVIKRVGAWLWSAIGKCPDRGELGSEEIADLRQLAQTAIEIRDSMSGPQAPFQDEEDEEQEEEVSERYEEDAMSGEVHGITNLDIEAAKKRVAQTTQVSDAVINGRKDLSSIGEKQAMTSHNDLSSQEKHVLVDMILTIVGEVYGQRDLLELRQVWEDGAQPRD